MIDHPAVHAVRIAKQRLHRTVNLGPLIGGASDEVRAVPSFKTAQVNKMLRVEIAGAELEALIRRTARSMDTFEILQHIQGEAEGPINVEGVDWYVIDKLPSPGWRVINPMEAA